MMEAIMLGIIGGGAYALQGIFKNKYELKDKFKLDPLQAGSSVFIGGLVGGLIVITGLPEPQIIALVLALGINKGIKAGLKMLVELILSKI